MAHIYRVAIFTSSVYGENIQAEELKKFADDLVSNKCSLACSFTTSEN